MSAASKCPKCYDEAMGCNTGEIDQNGYLDCLCGAADARVAMEKELGLTEAPAWWRDKAWRAYSMGVAAQEAAHAEELARADARLINRLDQVQQYTLELIEKERAQ